MAAQTPYNRDVLSDLHSLSMQLNRQAFVRPPVEGWLNSFLAVLYERFSNQNVQSVQVVHVIGTAAVQIGSAGGAGTHTQQGSAGSPAEQPSEQQYTLEESSPISRAIRSREMVTAPDMHVYPILVGDDPIGALIAHSDAPGPDVDAAFSTLALQLGPAIMQQVKTPGAQTGRLMRQIDLMRSVAEATQTVGSALDQREIVNRAARSLVETFKVDHAGIVLFDYAKGVGTVVGEHPDHGFVGMNVELRGTDANERLIRDHKPVIISNVPEATELGANRQLMSGLGLKSVVLLPMLAGDEVIGSIGMDSYYEDREFRPEELDAAMTLAGQLAVNVRNAQLYDEMKRRANQLERIGYLSRRVTSTLDRLEIFQIVKEETSSLIEAEQISVSLREGDSNRLHLFVLADLRPTEVEFNLDESALRFSMSGGEALVLDDISGSQYPDYKFMAKSGMRAALIVPLVIGGRTIGTYNVAHSQAGKYTSIDLAVLEQLGNQLAIALENARLYSQAAGRIEVEQMMNRMSGSIQQGRDVNNMLLGAMQQMAQALNARKARVRLHMEPRLSDSSFKRSTGTLKAAPDSSEKQ